MRIRMQIIRQFSASVNEHANPSTSPGPDQASGHRIITPVIRLRTDSADLDRLLRRAREGADANVPLRAVMEPTGSVWQPISSYLIQRDVTVHLIKPQQASDLRKFC